MVWERGINLREVEARLTDNWMFGDLEPGRTYLVDLGTQCLQRICGYPPIKQRQHACAIGRADRFMAG